MINGDLSATARSHDETSSGGLRTENVGSSLLRDGGAGVRCGSGGCGPDEATPENTVSKNFPDGRREEPERMEHTEVPRFPVNTVSWTVEPERLCDFGRFPNQFDYLIITIALAFVALIVGVNS